MEVCLFQYHTNKSTYIIFKIYIKTLKTLLHVSIIRSSSWSILCSLLKLQFKTLSDLLRYINPLTPNDPYSGRTAPLTSKCCILYIYSTNMGTEYFKHGIYSPFFSLQNAVCFIILTYLVPVLFTFYIQCVLKF